MNEMVNTITQGDCLEVMKRIPDGSVDMILADLPYGTTACKWDTIIPFEPLWAEYRRVIKDYGSIVLTSSQPFSSMIVSSNTDEYSHQWIWEKDSSGNFLLANTSPLKNFEDVLVFIKDPNNGYNNHPLRKRLRDIAVGFGIDNVIKLFEREGRYTTKQSARVHASYKMGFSKGKRFDLMDEDMFNYLSKFIDFGFDYEEFGRTPKRTTAAERRTYNPQGVKRVDIERVVARKPEHIGERPNQDGKEYKQRYTNYPKAIIKFPIERNCQHPAQKPVALFEYLIRTYTNEGETVLDNVIGSGTTAVAAINTGRNFIGIEQESEYVEIARRRVDEALANKNEKESDKLDE